MLENNTLKSIKVREVQEWYKYLRKYVFKKHLTITILRIKKSYSTCDSYEEQLYLKEQYIREYIISTNLFTNPSLIYEYLIQNCPLYYHTEKKAGSPRSSKIKVFFLAALNDTVFLLHHRWQMPTEKIHFKCFNTAELSLGWVFTIIICT